MKREPYRWSLVAIGGWVILTIALLGLSFIFYWRDMRIDPSTGIDKSCYVNIGGIEQWIQIRGEDRDNPILLWLNGGPGFSTIPHTYLIRSWEKQFTVVMWDQRGEGKTFEKTGTSVANTMTIDRMAQDGIEVVEYVSDLLQKDKIILLGHSWGSILGIRMIKNRPDLFSAYIGTGQIVNLGESASVAYPLLLKRARVLKNEKAEAELVNVGPPPYPSNGKTKFIWIFWANMLDQMQDRHPKKSFGWFWLSFYQFLFGPNSFPIDAQFSQEVLWEEMLSDDLRMLGKSFDVPIVMLEGSEDLVSPTSIARAYFNEIDAPSKNFIILPNQGHLAIFKDSENFLAALKEYVRPFAVQNGKD